MTIDKYTQQTAFDKKMMRNCIRLAKKGNGFVSPNPLVGATIVKNGRIIGEGWHQKYGQAHAEINAIANASESVEGATIYVNLEPCSHQGKTPACSLALIQHKFKRVVIATPDPNPLVAGNGIQMLQKAGIEVTQGVLAQEATELNERFFKFIKTKKPFVALKIASSLDGKIATTTGESKWITNENARRYGHQLRQKYRAILVGINTVLADNPTLDIRLKNSKIANPVRIVLDSNLRIPLTANILKTATAPTWIATTKAKREKIKKLQSMGVKVVQCPATRQGIDLNYLLDKIAEENIDSILVEGGGTVHFSFAEAKLVDKVYAFIAPKIIGGEKAKPSVGGKGFEKIQDVLELKNMKYRKIKNNLLIEAYS